MELSEFLKNAPVVTREKNSDVKNALNENKFYLSYNKRQDKHVFKLHYYDANKTIRVKQFKDSEVIRVFFTERKDCLVLSEDAKNTLEL